MSYRRIALLSILLAVCACSESRTKQHAGVNVRLVSISRTAEVRQGVMGSFRPRDPNDEIAVVKLEISPAGSTKVKLGAKDCELKDTEGKSHFSDSDMEFTLGGNDSKMPWDFHFAVPKSAMLDTLRIGTATFKLGGVRELDAEAKK